MAMEDLKKQAGVKAASFAKSGMLIGLGTGSTAYYAIEEIARRMQEENLEIKAVSTSFSTSLLCQQWSIPLLSIESVSTLDMCIDGADEIDPELNLIKGRGAAHTLEKIVAGMSKEFYVVADQSKKVDKLGRGMPVPVEILPAALSKVEHDLTRLGASEVILRKAGKSKDGPVISDNGNFILDAWFYNIENPKNFEKEINSIAGILDNGIFARYATKIILATSTGLIEF
jgi:ribose 5-phosphate isomerase A